MLEVTLHLIIPQGALRSQDLPVGARFLLLCYSLTLLAFFLLLTGAVIKIAFRTSSKFIPDRLGLRLIVRIVITFLIWFGLIFYLASWGLFWQTGSFIDSQVFIFMAPHPLQVFHWVDLDVALVIVAFACAGAFTITVWIPHWIARQARSLTRKNSFCLALGAGALCARSFLGYSLQQLGRTSIYARRNSLFAQSSK